MQMRSPFLFLICCLIAFLLVLEGCAPVAASTASPALAPTATPTETPAATPMADGTASAPVPLHAAERDDAQIDTVSQDVAPLSGVRICLDPGHDADYVPCAAAHDAEGKVLFTEEELTQKPAAPVGAGFKSAPTPISRGTEITQGATTLKQVALTFDCSAWVPRKTFEDILTTLERAGIRTTFFVTGQFIERYPDLFQRVAEHHELGNHSYSHPNFPSLSSEEQRRELQRTEELAQALGYTTRPLWRAPFGARTPEVINIAAEAGWPLHIFWSLQRIGDRWISGDSHDWLDVSPQQVQQKVVETIDRLGEGTIIVHHGGSAATAEALPAIIAAIQERGYTIVPVSELLPVFPSR